MAPRRKYVNRHILKELCQAQLSNEEISRVLRVSWDTLDRRYAEAIKAWRLQGPASARRRLYELGMRDDPITNKDGDVIGHKPASVPSLIFFLKNYGGMSDKIEHGGTIKHESADLSALSDSQLSEVARLVESATKSA